jgi:hypothetical protein
MCTIRLPIPTCAAPDGAAVIRADEYILGVELLESGAIGTHVRVAAIWQGFFILQSPRFAASPPENCFDLWGKRNHAGVGINYDEGAEVCRNHQCEEHEVQDEQADGGSSLAAIPEEILDCLQFRCQPWMARNARGEVKRTTDARRYDICNEADASS